MPLQLGSVLQFGRGTGRAGSRHRPALIGLVQDVKRQCDDDGPSSAIRRLLGDRGDDSHDRENGDCDQPAEVFALQFVLEIAFPVGNALWGHARFSSAWFKLKGPLAKPKQQFRRRKHERPARAPESARPEPQNQPFRRDGRQDPSCQKQACGGNRRAHKGRALAVSRCVRVGDDEGQLHDHCRDQDSQ